MFKILYKPVEFFFSGEAIEACLSAKLILYIVLEFVIRVAGAHETCTNQHINTYQN
jgi:hypothetical protein